MQGYTFTFCHQTTKYYIQLYRHSRLIFVMPTRLVPVLIFGCLIISLVQSSSNSTLTKRIACYSCKGNDCEQIYNDEEHVVFCNKHTQLCWVKIVEKLIRVVFSFFFNELNENFDRFFSRLVSWIKNRIEPVPVVSAHPVAYHSTVIFGLKHAVIRISATMLHVRPMTSQLHYSLVLFPRYYSLLVHME